MEGFDIGKVRFEPNTIYMFQPLIYVGVCECCNKKKVGIIEMDCEICYKKTELCGSCSKKKISCKDHNPQYYYSREFKYYDRGGRHEPNF